MLLATALALLITGCAQQTFTVQNKPAAVAPKETITHHFLFWDWSWRKLSIWPKFVAAQKMLFKTETQQTFVNGLLGFITLGIILRWNILCITHNNCMSCPSIWAALSALLINILLVRPVVLHSDQPLSGVGNNRSAVSASRGGGCIIHAGGGGGFCTDWQTALMCNRRRPAAASSRRHHFQL